MLPVLFLKFIPSIGSFFKNFAQFVIKYWKQLAVISMFLIIVYQNFMTFEALKWIGLRTIPGIEQQHSQQVFVLTQQLDACERGRQLLKSEIQDTNNRIQAWSEKTQQLQQQRDQLTDKLAKLQKQSDQTVQQILTQPTPQTCEQAIEYLKDGAQQLLW